MAEITNSEATLLGLLAEGPMHPYQIEKEVQWRDMRFWTELSMSSIYKLLARLEETALVDYDREITEGNRVRKVYRLTEAGRTALEERLRTILSEPEHIRWRMDIGISNLAALPKEDRLRCLRRYREALKERAAGYRELEKFLIEQGCPSYRLGLARRPVYLLEGELRWAEEVLRELESPDG